jgi:preprotein translocase subunit SecB
MDLIEYSVDRLVYRKNDKYDLLSERELEINPKFSITAYSNTDDPAISKVSVSCDIFENAQEDGHPFTIGVTVSGVFQLFDSENAEALIKYNAVAILLPYVRSAVSLLSSQSGGPPIILPIINVYSLQSESEKTSNN